MADRNMISTVGKVLIAQVLVIMLVSTAYYALASKQAAISSLLGGFVAFFPNLYFAIRISMAKGKTAKKVMHSFYAGESGKLILTAGLFFLIFQIPNLDFLVLLTGYVAVLSVFWFALLLWREY